MPEGRPDSKELGLYFSLAQVGMEMVVPVVVGLVLEHYLPWSPWGVVVGAVLGLAVGFLHLIAILNRHNKADASKGRRETP